MTVSLSGVREGLRALLATIEPKLHVYAEWPDQVVPPAVLIRLAGANYERSFGSGDGGATMDVELHLVVSVQGGLVNAEKAIELHLANAGAASIRAAVTADRTLGNRVAYTHVRGWSDYDTVEINGQAFVGAVVTLEVEHDV